MMMRARPAPTLPGKPVLVIDDDRQFVALVRAGLRQLGHPVIEARSAAKARSVLAARPEIAAIVVDGLLPDSNGIDLIAQLRQRGEARPVVFVSAFFNDRASISRLTELHVTGMFDKRLMEPTEMLKKLHFIAEQPEALASTG